jgi:hypothetical protein
MPAAPTDPSVWHADLAFTLVHDRLFWLALGVMICAGWHGQWAWIAGSAGVEVIALGLALYQQLWRIPHFQQEGGSPHA